MGGPTWKPAFSRIWAVVWSMGQSDLFDMTDANRRALARTWAPTLSELPAPADPRDLAAAFIGAKDRRKLAGKGTAMPDGSFPIPDIAHLKSAIRLARTDAQRAHIMKRARALGASNLIPDDWK